MKKVCKKCKDEKDISEFYFNKYYGHHFARCKECCRVAHFKGKSEEEVNEMLTKQIEFGYLGRAVRTFEGYLQALKEIDYATPGYVD